MLDASNPENSQQQKAKKAKVQTVRPVERFWPDAIATLQPRASGHNGMAATAASSSPSGSATPRPQGAPSGESSAATAVATWGWHVKEAGPDHKGRKSHRLLSRNQFFQHLQVATGLSR